MPFKETIAEIQKILERTPYSREEIASFWQAEAEKEWEPETIMALAAAYEYLNRIGNPEAEHLRGKYERLLGELKDRYAQETLRPHPLADFTRGE